MVAGGLPPAGVLNLLSQMCPDDPCRRNEYDDLAKVVMDLPKNV